MTLSDVALKELNEQIEKTRTDLFDNMKKIPQLKQNMNYDLFKFGIIGFVCIFFAIILVNNTTKTLNLYFRNKNYERLHQKSNAPNDENEYYTFDNDINYRTELRRNIHKASNKQNQSLENAKREKLASTGKEVNDETLKSQMIEANIELNSIDKNNDEYFYVKDRSTANSFWEMLFERKKNA